MLNKISDYMLLRIFKYFQTHKINNDLIKSKKLDKFQIRLHNWIKTDVDTVRKISEINKDMYNFIMKSEHFKIFWVSYYNSLCHIEKECEHSVYCNINNCKFISHYVNRKNNKKFTNIFKNISKYDINEASIVHNRYTTY